MLRVIEARGDYYDCGRTFGSKCAESIAYRLSRELEKDSVEKYRGELTNIDLLCRELYPEYIQELEGIAEGARADYWELLLLNTPELMERSQGCTTIAVAGGSELYLVHNEDGSANERSEDCVLLHYNLPGGSFHAFTYAGELAGGSYSWNNYGLYFSVNFLKPIHIEFDGRVSRNFVARKVIEAQTIEAAISILEHGQDMSGYHYYIGQSERLVSIENFGNEVSLKDIHGIDVHANHYMHEKFLARATGKPNSLIRQKRAEELTNEDQQPLQILADRENLPNAICTGPGEGLHTISTIGFYPKENKVVLYEPGILKEGATFKM
ncbi:MAG: C45 family autoproteolytic acyltransferase/hydrolase [Minisyncoccota bacterium]